MTNQSKKMHDSALTAGTSLIVMMFMAFYAFGYVNNQLVVEDDPVATLSHIILSKGLFLSGIFSWIIVIITDFLVTAALYIYLKEINRTQSLIGALLRFIYTIFLMAAVWQLFRIYFLVSNNTAGSGELAATVDGLLASFDKIWSFGLIIFGAHLFMIGYIVLQSAFVPRILSLLLIIAGISYSLIHFLSGFVPQVDGVTRVLELVLSVPMTIGEVGFGIWLLIKGRKLEKLV